MEPNETNQSSGNGKKVGIGIAVVALLAIVAVVFGSKKSDTPAATDTTSSPQASTDTATTPTTDTTSAATGSTAASNTAMYKDGTYTATGSYQSPGGPDKVGVTLTLKNDIVTAATVKAEPGDRESAYYQNIFVQNYTPLVVGKDVSTIKLSKVSGSSLTSGGFNDAVTQIEAQAKA